MLSPFLLVGVGGSGGKTLRVVRDNLARRLDQAGWGGAFPKAWQFVHIDVPTTADGNDPDLPEQLPESDYQGMVGSGLNYRTIDSALIQDLGEHSKDAVGGWRPDPNRVLVPVAKGAGQFRALGRVITIAGLEQIKDALNRAKRELTGAEVTGELQRVSELLGGGKSTTPPPPSVIVISSIAGGTGSGAFIDVCDAIRAMGDEWATHSVGILYAPDVFDYLPEPLRRGVRPNSLAALSELLNGFWNDNGPSEGTSRLFAKYGIQFGSEARLGPRFPFLVGARNEYVTYKTQNDIYLAMGRSIASWVSSAALQDQMTAYTQANFPNNALGVPDKLPLHARGTETPFVAMGSARVGLGRDRFQEYSAQHLARTVVERFLHEHESRRVRGDERTEKQLVKDVADDVFGGFLAASGLNERGEEHNQIIDSLQSPSLRADLKAVYTETLAKMRDAIPEKGARADHVRRQLRSLINDRHSSFQSQQLAARAAKAKEWIATIQSDLPNLAASYIAKVGAPVTVELLRRVNTEIKQVRDELGQEASHRRRWASDLDQEVRAALDDQDAAVILKTTDRLDEAVKRAVRTYEFEQEAEVRELAAELIPDLAANVIDPLIEAISDAISSLSNEVNEKKAGRSSQFAHWPIDDTVPERLRPAPNEFLLEAPDDYFTLLRDLIRRTVGDEVGADARIHAEQQAMLGTDELESAAQTLIARDKTWAPKNRALNASVTAAPSRARFTVRAGVGSILERCNSWLLRPGTQFGRYLSEGLRDYLDPKKVSPADITARLSRFEGQLIAALNAGAPLVDINPAVLMAVHGRNDAKYTRSFGEIPLPDKSPARDILKSTLEARGEWDERIAKAFSDGNGADIDLFTLLWEPYEPVVFNSIMRPIASDWAAKSKSSDQRAEFWRWRRARPLAEALPVSPSVLTAMVRGWFVARLLDHLEVSSDSVQVFVPSELGRGGGLASFPHPLLTNVKPGPDLLPALLESISLAMLDVNTMESISPMMPYQRLVDLGHGSPDEVPDELYEWIQHGTNARGNPEATDLDTRRDACVDRVDKLLKTYEAHFERISQRTELLDYPGAFELRNEIRATLGSLRRAIEAVSPAETEGEF